MDLGEATSIWVDGSGRAVAGECTQPLDTDEHRGHAMDRLGWVHLRARPDRVEFWVNPLSAHKRTVHAALALTARVPGVVRDRPLIVQVHDRQSRGTLVAQSLDAMSALIDESVELTSRPAFPMMQDRLTGCLPTEINDRHVQRMWKYLVATRFQFTDELVERVQSAAQWSQLLVAETTSGSVRFVAHDRASGEIWRFPNGFAGCRLDELPFPGPLKRSLKADVKAMLAERTIVVSLVRGLRRVMPVPAPMDSYFRVCIPLSCRSDASDRPALVMLSPYG